MHYFYFDASALAKRYSHESGSNLVNFLFDRAPLERLKCLTLGGLEVFWILVRKRNDGRITANSFSQAVVNLNSEVLADDSDFELLLPSSLLSEAMDLIDRHSINSTDALILCSALEVGQRLRSQGDDLVLVASDRRLLRAASAEGMPIFNPETESQQVLSALIS